METEEAWRWGWMGLRFFFGRRSLQGWYLPASFALENNILCVFLREELSQTTPDGTFFSCQSLWWKNI